MKFSKTLQHLAEVDRVYGPQYMQYKLLKKFLKETKDGSTEEGTFVRMVESEHQRVIKIADYKLSELQLTCGGLITNLRAQQISSKRSVEERISQMQTLAQHADELGCQLAALERYVIYNKEGFRKIVKKHDKRHKLSLSWMETQRMRTVFVRYLSDLERLLVELSTIYQHIKQISEGEMAGEHAVSDETFERKSYKYWVSAEDVFDLKTRLIKHLPIHIFNHKSDGLGGSLTTEDLLLEPAPEITEKGVKYDQLGWISSVYLDNDDLDCYRTRVNMEEGATLLRVRWYGDPKDLQWTDDMCLPRAPEKGLYFERKTHHESWVQTKSLKERFPISESKVNQFMKGDLTPKDVTKGDSSLQLAEEMQNEVLKRKLHSMIRTCYKRTAFQLEATNDVRVTLDTELTFVNDNPRYLTEGQWKRSEQDVDENGDWDRFPFAVLEVKLKAGEPQWLQEILTAPYIRHVQKFSKFQQACATFYPDRVHMFPYWFTKDDIAQAKENYLQLPRGRTKRFPHQQAHRATMKANGREQSSSEPSSNGSIMDAQTYSNPAFSSSDELHDIHVISPDPIYSYSEVKKVFRDPSLDENGTKSKPDSSTANGTPVPYGGIPGKDPGKKNEVVATKRVKIEPKTFFANERTYLQWLRTGLNLFSVGGVLFNLGSDNAALYSGIAFLILSTVIMTYGVIMFYWRMHMIKYRKTQRFDDWFGPGMLFVIMIAALVTTIVFHILYADDTTNPQGQMLQPSETKPITGLPPFYEAHGLASDPTGVDAAWTCSDGLLTKIDLATGQVTNNIPVKGNPLFVCHGLAAIDTTDILVAVTMTTDSQGIEQHSLLFYDKQSRTINSTLTLDFLSGPITGFTFVPVLLQPVLSQAFLYGGTFLVSTQTSLTAIQLYMDDDDVTVLPHVFHIPLPGKYVYAGPLASDVEYMFLVAHPSVPMESEAVLAYDVSSGTLTCVKPVNVTGIESGMLVQKIQGTLYQLQLLQQAPHHDLVTFEMDLSNCTRKDEL